jgi:hypothetical protein
MFHRKSPLRTVMPAEPRANQKLAAQKSAYERLGTINALVFRELSRNGLLGSARDRYRQVGIAEMICQDWANRSALLTNEQRGKSFRVLAEESYMTSEWRTIVALVVPTDTGAIRFQGDLLPQMARTRCTLASSDPNPQKRPTKLLTWGDLQ